MITWLHGDTCYSTIMEEERTGGEHGREKEDPHRR